mmetsp:Transcript_7657/g.23321  ORF Transcript_7657/g.23321 Transcript_7657/m.23321 type:complete len:354 (+) Transcript_7657:60-1121(+)
MMGRRVGRGWAFAAIVAVVASLQAPMGARVGRRCARGGVSMVLSEGSEVDEDSLLSPKSWGSSSSSSRSGSWAHPYRRGADGGSEVDEDVVNELLEERWEAKGRREFGIADEIRALLSEEHGVMIFEKRQEWTVGRGPDCEVVRHDYERQAGDESEVDVAAVDQILLERLRAKLRHDFRAADDLKDRLRYEHGVRISDGDKTWRGGVEPQEEDRFPRRAEYRRVDDHPKRSSSHEVDIGRVTQLITDRHNARRRKLWHHADAILEQLISMGVVVDDRARTWQLVDAAYAAVGDWPDVDETDLDSIARLVARRRVCKLRRQFDEADRIRDELRNDFSVQVNDADRTYSLRSPVA